ncbi:thioesterase family protein [Actinomadura gamaensis]|uniref:Thioesterase family protein n=1 Tax=Actinomadura gamaensis TaxID=1763541 RepID=A0ABV9TY81_9ACTN
MGDLAIDAAVRGADGHYTAELSPEWSAWGPNGGYVAAVLARTALTHGELPRIASLSCQFLKSGRFAPVELTAVTTRSARRAEAVRVTMAQDGVPLAEALAWLVADGQPGMRHDDARLPDDIPDPEGQPTFAELSSPDTLDPPPLWENIDSRAVTYGEGPSGEAFTHGWYRFLKHSTDDVGRQLVLLDVLAFPAAWNRHLTDTGFIAPNLDLNVQFHRSGAAEEWLYAEARSEIAEDGLIGYRSRVWSRDRRLLASAAGQLLCRPAG